MTRSQAESETGELGRGIARRAAQFLNFSHPGGAKDKRIAQAFGISPGMAKLLRGGRGWTVNRLEQAMRIWPEFRDFVFQPTDELSRRLDQLVGELAQLRTQIATLREDIRHLREEALRAGSMG